MHLTFICLGDCFTLLFLFCRQSNPYYDTSDIDGDIGIENTHGSEMYAYSDKPRSPSVTDAMRTGSAASFRTESAVFLKDTEGLMSSTSDVEKQKRDTPVMAVRRPNKTKTYPVDGVPQTDV